MSLRVRVLLLFALLPVPALAQTPGGQPMSAAAQASCAGGRISYVFIDNKSIFDTSDPELDRRFRWAYRTANALHVRTKEWVIRRELLFGPGACYDPFLIDETERLLRSYDFLSEVGIYGVRQPDGSWHVIVDTRDDWSTRVDVRLRTSGGIELEGLRVTEDNLLGTGQSLGAFYVERDVTRDYGIAYYTPQLLGTRWDLTSAVGRTRAGTLVHQEIAYPFVGEVSRWGGRESFRRDEQFFDYVVGDDPDLNAPNVLLPVREQSFDLTVVRRIGRRGNMALLGVALTYQELSYPGPIQLAPEGDYDRREPAPDSLAAGVMPQHQQLDNIRAFVLLGHRNVWWVRRRGLDSMRGQEDVRLGAEAVLALGRSIPALETDDDLYTMLALYTGIEFGGGLFVGRARADVRRDLMASAGTSEWEDLYLESELLTYLQSRLLPGQTVFFRAGFTGAWNTRTPFQLTLGGDYGLRGYARERLPGGRRLVLTLEDRIYFGWPFRDVLDLGGTLFADLGRMWRGDAPFGVNSGWHAAAGLGLRGSFPAGSRTTYRVDLAWPLATGARPGDFRLTLTVGEMRGLHQREPDRQLTRSRTQDVGGSLFTFRN